MTTSQWSSASAWLATASATATRSAPTGTPRSCASLAPAAWTQRVQRARAARRQRRGAAAVPHAASTWSSCASAPQAAAAFWTAATRRRSAACTRRPPAWSARPRARWRRSCAATAGAPSCRSPGCTMRRATMPPGSACSTIAASPSSCCEARRSQAHRLRRHRCPPWRRRVLRLRGRRRRSCSPTCTRMGATCIRAPARPRRPAAARPRAPSSICRCRRAPTMRVFAAVWPQVIAHLERFEPEFIILQCGADSLEGDPITHLRFTAAGARPRRARAGQLADRSATGACWPSAAGATTAPISPGLERGGGEPDVAVARGLS